MKLMGFTINRPHHEKSISHCCLYAAAFGGKYFFCAQSTSQCVILRKWANFNGRDINYVTVPFVSDDFGSPSEIAYFSHELSHAYDSFVGNTPVPLMQSFSQKAITESNAVSFENYIRSVYGVPFLRKHYPEFEGSSMFQPVTKRVKGEAIRHFREIDKGKDGRSFGFRYVSLIDGIESTHYIVAGIDDNRYFYFNIYDTEEEYLERTEGWL